MATLRRTALAVLCCCGPATDAAAAASAAEAAATNGSRCASREECLGRAVVSDSSGDEAYALLQRAAAPASNLFSENPMGSYVGSLPSWARQGQAAREMSWEKVDREQARPFFWDAPVDHFAPPWETKATFRQTYFVKEDYYAPGGPVFFELGGEGPIHGPPGGFIAALAKERQAMLVQVEHRFYGGSVPNGNVNTSNLKLLTVDQALADYAAFIDWFSKEKQLLAGTKWFAFGGSYPGALASWFRAAYPEKTVGSLSSSGVVNSIFDFTMFDIHIARAIGPECAAANRAITAAFEKAVLARGAQEEYAKGLFGCQQSMLDGDFFYMLADGLAMMVQYGAKSRLCSNITAVTEVSSTPEQIMENAAHLVKQYWGSEFGTTCFYDTTCLSDPSRYEVGDTDRSWRWQKCYELAYFQSAPLAGQMEDGTRMLQPLRSFMVNMTYMVEQCYAVFGSDFNPVRGVVDFSTRRINTRFGGAQPIAKKVFYSNFGDDPWLEASVMPPRDVDPEQPYEVAMCDDCGHCMDFSTPRPTDPPELKRVRARFQKYLDLWLAE